MATKDELLLLLEKSRGRVLSGEAVAQQLGISRAAVGKAITALRKEGLQVEALTGAGYCLPKDSDFISEAGIRAMPGGGGFELRVYEKVESTNLLAKQWAMEENAPHGSMVVTGCQTAGRGRLGRSFTSPPGGLYMSIVLRPPKGAPLPMLLTAAAGVAVCQSVQALCKIQLGIKWVNDLFWQDKKCCGILTEAASGLENGAIEYLVVGIGLNYCVKEADFPPEVAAIATSLYPNGGAPVPRTALAADIRGRLLALFEDIDKGEFLKEYKARSFVLGKQVQVLANSPYMARAVDIDDAAGLVVETPRGRTTLTAGEISIRPQGRGE